MQVIPVCIYQSKPTTLLGGKNLFHLNMLFLSAENMFFLSLQLLPTTGGITDLNYRYSMRESTDFHSLKLAKKEAMNVTLGIGWC